MIIDRKHFPLGAYNMTNSRRFKRNRVMVTRQNETERNLGEDLSIQRKGYLSVQATTERCVRLLLIFYDRIQTHPHTDATEHGRKGCDI